VFAIGRVTRFCNLRGGFAEEFAVFADFSSGFSSADICLLVCCGKNEERNGAVRFHSRLGNSNLIGLNPLQRFCGFHRVYVIEYIADLATLKQCGNHGAKPQSRCSGNRLFTGDFCDLFMLSGQSWQ
jgi:hypothetical protein